MKRLVLTLLLTHVALVFFAQKQCLVVDENNVPIELANVIILNEVDSTLITGGITNKDGIYHFESDEKNSLMRVSMIGYETLFFHQPYPDKVQLIPSTVSLNEVKVKGYRQHVKPTPTGLVVKMDNNPLSKLSSIGDAIKQMPMVNPIDGSILGKGQPEIYINNRKIRDASELQQLSPEKVIDVEIITRPGPKYDSHVTSVIIIHTKKIEQELAGIVRGSSAVSEVFTGSANADLSYMFQNGLGLYGGAMFASNGFEQERIYHEQFNEGKSQTLTQGNYRSHSYSLKTNLGLSYDFSPEKSIGLRYEFNRMPTSHYKAQSDMDVTTQLLNETIISFSAVNSQSYQHAVNAYSNLRLGSKKIFTWTTDADYLYGNSNKHSTANETGLSDWKIFTSSSTAYSLIAAKTNLNINLKKLNMDVGTQYSYTTNKMHFDSSDNANSDFLSSSHDSEKQHLYAGYASINYGINEHWNLNGGLRLEQTGFDYRQNDMKIEEQSKSYTDLLPTLGVHYRKGNLALGLTYASNVNRPPYSYLHNNYTYVSHTSWEKGNPLLKSALTHSIDLSFSWKQSILGVSFTRNVRSINTVYTYLPSENVIVRQEINMPDFNRVTFMATQSLNIVFWHPTIQGILYCQCLDYGNPVQRYNKLLAQISMSNRFDLPWGIYAYLGSNWMSKGHYGSIYFEGNRSFYFILNKSFKNWIFNVSMNDFANTYRYKLLGDTNGVSYRENRKGASRVFSLSITYTFKQKKSYKGKSAATSEMNRF